MPRRFSTAAQVIDAALLRKFVTAAQRDVRCRPRQLARPFRRASLVSNDGEARPLARRPLDRQQEILAVTWVDPGGAQNPGRASGGPDRRFPVELGAAVCI